MAAVYVLYLGVISWTKATSPMSKKTCTDIFLACSSYGWQNFLLVNDIFGGSCLEHTRFLSMDLHFYLIAILVCLCYRRFGLKKLSRVLAFGFGIVGWIIMVVDAFVAQKKYGGNKLFNMMTDPCYSMPLDPNNQTCFEAQQFMEESPFGPMGFGFLVPDFQKHFMLPWSHLICYSVGIFVGIVLQEMTIKSYESYKMTNISYVIGWSLAIVGLVLGFLFPANEILGYPWILGRNLGIAGFLTWICYLLFQTECFAESSNHKMFYNSIIILGGSSGKNWSKVFTWCVLIGPILMEFYYRLWLEETIFIQDSLMLVMWLGFCCFTFASSWMLKVILF